MDNKLHSEFNNQINLEFNSSYLYFAMSTYFDELFMEGFSSFSKEMAINKLSNAQKMYDYLILRDEKLIFNKVEEPDSDWINISDVFSIALSHEEFMLEKIKDLYKLAQSLNDVGVMEFILKLISNNEKNLCNLRKMVFRIKNSNIIPTSVELLDKMILEESLN